MMKKCVLCKIRIFILITVVILIDGSHLQESQALIDYMGSSLSLGVGVVDNFDKDPDNYVPMQLILNNTGDMVIGNGHWKIYFSNLYGAKVEDLDCGLTLVHVNGDLFYLYPTPEFPGLQPGSTISCTWHQRLWNIAISDFFPNWFVSSDGLLPRVIESTNETFAFLLPYNTPQKWKRSREDVYNPFTPQERFKMHRFKSTESKQIRNFHPIIIPTPFSKVVRDTEIIFSPDDGWVIKNSTDFPREAKYLADMTALPVVNTLLSEKYVQFVRDTHAIVEEEAYLLNVSDDKITITSRDMVGAFYGVQSLLSLSQAEDRKTPTMDIYDKPRFPYRGLMIDTARSFKPKEWIFQLLDVMTRYKLNRLHLHLSDDGAWRQEIQGIPELTEMGSYRCLRSDISPCLIPQRGSGPDNTTSGSGYYSVEDYRDILKYAAERHIVVVPEFDMPGHSRASVASMEYRETKIRHSTNVPSYKLSDVVVNTSVKSQQHWVGNVMNPCFNTTYAFVNKVIDEMIRMHKGIMDLKTFHLGGDEVPDGVLDDTPACQHLPGPKDTKSLKRFFVKRVAEIVASKGLDVAAWEDGVYADGKPNPITDFKSRNVYSYVWYNNWEKGRGNRSALFADAGYKVILTMATHLYLDHAQEPDPQEMGLYWASRYTNTEKVFGFMADDIFANADKDAMGGPIVLKELCKNNWCPKTMRPENVKGIQASMFSDQIRNKQQMHNALFPRLIAVAERAWHKAPWESIEDKVRRDTDQRADWERMVNILGYQELPRLEKMDIEYRIPPPGARLEDDILKVNTLYPNHEVMMSLDGGSVWEPVHNNSQLISAGTYKIHLKTVSPILRRSSRVITLEANVEVPSAATTHHTWTASGARLWLLVAFVSLRLVLYQNI